MANKTNYLYSIIIPHYNIPELLVRCLKSIPVREDIQVIVVDDCSPDADTYKERFPEIFSRPNLEWYSTPIGGSAGRARNIGLEQAKGKWLIFLDSDDMLVDGVESILNEVQNRTEDIIYFDTISVMNADLSKPSNRNFYHQYFEQYQIDKDERSFRYRFQALWGKVFRTAFIREHKIRFDETRYSNDVKFSVAAGLYAKNIAIDNKTLFIVTEREGSLASNQFGNIISKNECEIRLKVAIGIRELLEKNGIYNEEYQVTEYLGKLRAYYRKTYYQYLFILIFRHPTYVIPFLKKDILFVLKKMRIVNV